MNSGAANEHDRSDGCGSCDDPAAQAGAGSRTDSRRESASRLRLALALAAVYMVAEAFGGWWTNSLALLADSGHMLSDVAALGISLAALRAAARAPTSSRTWGFHRAEALAALANATFLCVVAAGICWQAAHRLTRAEDVEASLAFVIATGGLLVNLTGMSMLGHGDEHGIGVRSAWLHMLGDALGSAGAMASAALIALFGWRWADPVASLLIALLIVRSAFALLMETVDVLMEAAPHHIDVDTVRAELEGLAGVKNVHDLHVWTITSGMEALSGHITVAAGTASRDVLVRARRILRERFHIDHVTLQIEEVHEPVRSG
jgi:cobalt-zinc-cadmium efflux system protein